MKWIVCPPSRNKLRMAGYDEAKKMLESLSIEMTDYSVSH